MDKSMQVTVALQGVDKLTPKLKGAIDRVKELTGSAQTAKTRLKDIAISQNQIKGFADLKARTDAAKTALEAAREKATALGKAVSIGQATKRELEAARKAVRSLDDQYAGLLDRTNKARGALRDKGVETSKLASKTRELRQESERLQKVMDRERRASDARARADAMRSRAGSLAGTGATMVAPGYGILRGLAGLVGPGMEFDAAMSRVQALTRLDARSAELKALREQAKMLGATTSFSGGDVASGQAFLAMAGFTPAAIKAAMPGLLDMAKAGDIDLARGADISSNILSAFGIDPSQMSRVADVLTRTFTTANTNLQMLGGTMKYVAPIAKAAGMSFEESAAMAGLMGNIGIQDSMAGTALRAMVNRLAAPAKAGKDALDSLGVSAVDARGNMRSLPTVLFEIARATERMGSGERLEKLKHIFGEEAAAGMADLVGRAGSDELRKYIEVVEKSQGAAAAVANTMGNNMAGDIKGMSSAWESVNIAFTEANSGWMRSTIQWFTDITRGISTFMTEHPGLVRGIAIVATALGTLLVVGGSLLLLLAGIMLPLATIKLGFSLLSMTVLPALKVGFLAVAGAIKAVFAFLMANPIVLVIMAIIGALYLLYRNWGAIWAFIKDQWNSLATWFTSIKNRFVTWGSEMISGLIQGVKSGASALWEGLKSTVGGAVDKVKNFLGIRSPSRVFAEIGGHTTAGLALGIQRGTPAAVDTVRRMAAGITVAGATTLSPGMALAAPGGPGVMGGAAAGGVTIGQVSIVIEGTGLDAEAIARAVDQRLRQMASQARTDAQSRFFDDN